MELQKFSPCRKKCETCSFRLTWLFKSNVNKTPFFAETRQTKKIRFVVCLPWGSEEQWTSLQNKQPAVEYYTGSLPCWPYLVVIPEAANKNSYQRQKSFTALARLTNMFDKLFTFQWNKLNQKVAENDKNVLLHRLPLETEGAIAMLVQIQGV